MKLAEALLLRADLNKKLASLRERINRNAIVQEGETPKEKVEDLLAEATSALEEQQKLVRTINAANESTRLADARPVGQGRPVAECHLSEQGGSDALSRKLTAIPSVYNTLQKK